MPDHEGPQPLDYATPVPRPRSRSIVIGLVVLIVADLVLFSILMPSQNGGGPSPRAQCASNMHQIGLAILLYQNDHAGVYPNALEELMEEQITTSVFICPDSNDTASTGATTQAIGADFHAGGHLSYIYLGKGLNDKNVTDDTVVLYEPLAHHGGLGMNVLFGDGHAEWINAALGAKLITAAASGKRMKVNVNAGTVTISPIVATQPAAH